MITIKDNFSSIVIISALFVSTATISADEVYSKNKKGNDYYKNEKFEDALKEYDDALLIAPADTLLRMNRGSALYRLGAYAGTLSMQDKRKRADALYNLGNIQFKEGEMLMQGGGKGADEKFTSALQNYIAALDLRPDDRDTKWNIELTQQRIRQQQQQQQQNQKQKNNDKNDIKPSEYAKKMKKLADKAVSERKYSIALDIMTEALQKDRSVAAYQDFIKRLKDVNGIKS